MQIFLVVSLYIALFLYLYLFINKTSEVAYKIHNNKKENLKEDISFNLFNFYKISSYVIMFIILIAGIFIAPNIRLNGWMYIFYILWIIGVLFIKLNISLIDHLINVLYVKGALKKIEKEYLIGAFVKENNRYCFSYRIKRDKLYI